VVTPGDVEALAFAMEELVVNPVMRRQMGQHSEERILHYSPEACASGIANAVLSRDSISHE
jgi:glycosyltransferase involved in cell wall biosynthesis